MGALRKPLEFQKGRISNQKRQEKALEEKLVTVSCDQLTKPPSWLRDTLAKNEWKRLVEIFEEIGMIGNLDYNNLGAYCNAFSSFVDITKQLKNQDYLINHTNKVGATNIAKNPLITIQQSYSEEMRQYSKMLGLSIDSRLKAAPNIRKNSPDNGSEFGDI